MRFQVAAFQLIRQQGQRTLLLPLIRIGEVTTSDVLVTSLTFTPTTGNNTTATPSGGSITLDATGDGTLAVAYSANDTIVERTGTLTLSAKNGENVLTTNPSPVTTTLTQAAAARSIAFSSSSLSADTAAGTKDVTITSNSDWRGDYFGCFGHFAYFYAYNGE